MFKFQTIAIPLSLGFCSKSDSFRTKPNILYLLFFNPNSGKFYHLPCYSEDVSGNLEDSLKIRNCNKWYSMPSSIQLRNYLKNNKIFVEKIFFIEITSINNSKNIKKGVINYRKNTKFFRNYGITDTNFKINIINFIDLKVLFNWNIILSFLRKNFNSKMEDIEKMKEINKIELVLKISSPSKDRFKNGLRQEVKMENIPIGINYHKRFKRCS